MKNENKIRRMLGRGYHLSTTYGGEDVELTKWVLFKQYDNADPIYWSDDNQPIMSSDTHTFDELYEYAKKHKRFDIALSWLTLNLIMSYTILGIAIINIIVNSPFLKSVILTSNIFQIIHIIAYSIISKRNHKINMLEISENFERLQNIRLKKQGGNNE